MARKRLSTGARNGAKTGLGFGFAVSRVKGHNKADTAFVTSVYTLVGGVTGHQIQKRKEHNMAKKGSWAKGNAPAQGSTPKRVSRPVSGTGKFKGSFKKGKRTAKRGGTS